MIMNQSQRWTRNSTLKGLELEDSISLKDAQLTKFMLNFGHETTRLKGLRNYMELMYMNLLIHLFTSSKLSSINDRSQRIHN